MSKLIGNRYVLKSGSYLADLAKVDFVTWRESDDGIMLKLHVGTKEIRFFCDLILAHEVLANWTKIRGQEIDIENYTIGGKHEFNQ